MRHFLTYLSVVFFILFLSLTYQSENKAGKGKKTLRIYTYTSFASNWGPAPKLKEIFEKKCQCEVEFIEGSDAGILLQRIRLEGESLGADVVIGFDQFDLEKATRDLEWEDLNYDYSLFTKNVSEFKNQPQFVPYDWGALSFVRRKDFNQVLIEKLDDLLKPELNQMIALQDPRTSSPGYQLLSWVYLTKDPESAGQFIANLLQNSHSVSPSWSSSYGLFKQKQAQIVFSYITSPLYHKIEENDVSYEYIKFQEGYVSQFEFAGVPKLCKECELAKQFVDLLVSSEGQKIVMNKNYMFPVVESVAQGTQFEDLMKVKVLNDNKYRDVPLIEQRLKKWSELRRTSSQ